MGRLADIAAEHADLPALERRNREASDREKQKRRQETFAACRRIAMEKAQEVTGRVIFPARWDARFAEDRNYPVHCSVRWEGIKLRAKCVKSRDGWWCRLYVVLSGKEVQVQKPADLAKLVIDHGLA